MRHWIAIFIVLTLTSCMHEPNNFNAQTRSYAPAKELTPALDQCISIKGEMVRCDRAK